MNYIIQKAVGLIQFITMQKYNVVIVGGGPAGCAAALRLADSGLKILLLDKAVFPRDKTCGDALSVDVLNQLPILSETLARDFENANFKMPSWGVRIFSPDQNHLDIPFIHKGTPKNGYICARKDFDNLLFKQVKKSWKIEVLEDFTIDKVEYGRSNLTVHSGLKGFSTDMLIGADGANSVVKRFLLPQPIKKSRHSAGLRVYYEGVKSFHENQYIELHFFEDILPGYLWIFPMTGNRANVGIGMLSSEVAKKKVNLKEVLNRVILKNPAFKERFADALPMETVKGFGLPLGYEKRVISGDRFLLTGDAAGLIDPFSGEGIGNAIRSGRVAAEHILNCFQYENFSADFNRNYDKEIYKRMGSEFKVSYALQRLCRYPGLFNFVIKKAASNKYWQDFFKEALADQNQKKQFLNPLFYYRMFFK